MSPYLAEFLGTALFLFLGCGVCANMSLKKTGGHNGGIIVITLGWAAAFLMAASMFGPAGGAHFNPAMTIAQAVIGTFEWSMVLGYIACQFLGAMFGAFLAWTFYHDHFDIEEDPDVIRGIFCTSPGIRNFPLNCWSEFVGAFILAFCALAATQTSVGNVLALNNYTVAGLIFAIGVCIGGTTGYAINPARDLGPRIVHALLPIRHKGSSDWGYAWVPVIMPIFGTTAAALLYTVIF